MTEQFDISALEKALSTKSRKPRQDLTPKPSLSKRELYDETKRLAEEYDNIYGRKLRTRHQGDSYYVDYGELRRNRRRVEDIEQVPRAAFEKLIVNGRRHLKDYHEAIQRVIQENPTLALEAHLEGKSNTEVLAFVYTRRTQEIEELLLSRVVSPDASIFIQLNITMRPPLGEPFDIGITSRLKERCISISGITAYPKNTEDTRQLVHFITHFEQVIDEINRQLDKIEIRKEVIK